MYIDDNSEYTTKQKKYITQKLQNHIVIFNSIRKYSVRNAYEAIHEHATKSESVIVSLDGDDWMHSRHALRFLNVFYKIHQPMATYGSCLAWKNNALLKIGNKFENKKYPTEIIANGLFRKHPFLPLHPRTWKTKVFKQIRKEDFLNDQGDWLKYCEDQAIFFPILEMYPKKVLRIPKLLSVYNLDTTQSDNKTHFYEQIQDEIEIRTKTSYEPIS